MQRKGVHGLTGRTGEIRKTLRQPRSRIAYITAHFQIEFKQKPNCWWTAVTSQLIRQRTYLHCASLRRTTSDHRDIEYGVPSSTFCRDDLPSRIFSSFSTAPQITAAATSHSPTVRGEGQCDLHRAKSHCFHWSRVQSTSTLQQLAIRPCEPPIRGMDRAFREIGPRRSQTRQSECHRGRGGGCQ